MKIRGLLACLLCAVVLGGCARSATAPEAPDLRASFNGDPPPPPDTTSRGGGALGSGH
jgi:hypothetical protein